MSLFGTPIVQSVAGLGAAERIASKDLERRRAARSETTKRSGDAVEISSSQADDAVRNLKDNGNEETREDRAEQDHYLPQKAESPEGEGPRHIDVQG